MWNIFGNCRWFYHHKNCDYYCYQISLSYGLVLGLVHQKTTLSTFMSLFCTFWHFMMTCVQSFALLYLHPLCHSSDTKPGAVTFMQIQTMHSQGYLGNIQGLGLHYKWSTLYNERPRIKHANARKSGGPQDIFKNYMFRDWIIGS